MEPRALMRFLGIHHTVFIEFLTGFEAFYDNNAFLPLDSSLCRIWGLLGFSLPHGGPDTAPKLVGKAVRAPGRCRYFPSDWMGGICIGSF